MCIRDSYKGAHVPSLLNSCIDDVVHNWQKMNLLERFTIGNFVADTLLSADEQASLSNSEAA